MLLRQCAGFGKLVYSTRVVPLAAHAEALREFDMAVRQCFEDFTCLRLEDTYWDQARLATKEGGLGLRRGSQHSSCGFLASRSSCVDLCKQLDPGHVYVLSDESSDAHHALQTYNSSVDIADAVLPSTSDALPQKKLSTAVDKTRRASGLSEADAARRGHLSLLSNGDSGLWLHAPPTKAARNIVDPVLYVTMLQRRLRAPIFDAEFHCPFCDGIMDRFADHALTCSAGGDRSKRHNAMRNCAFSACC